MHACITLDRKWKSDSHPLAPCLWVGYEHSHSEQCWLANNAGLVSAPPASCSLFSDWIMGRHRILAIICEVKWKFSRSEWVAIPFSRASSWPKDWTWVFRIAGRFFTFWVTRELAHTGERSGGGKSSHLMIQNNFYLCLYVSGTFMYLFCSYLSFLRPIGKLGTLYDWNVHETRSPWELFSSVYAAFTWHSWEGVFNFQTVSSNNGQVWDGDSYTTWNIQDGLCFSPNSVFHVSLKMWFRGVL